MQAAKSFLLLLVVAATASLLGGCSNVGNAPAGDDDAVKNAIPKMSRQQKIDFINGSPLTPEQKKAKLKEMGIEDAPVTDGRPGAR